MRVYFTDVDLKLIAFAIGIVCVVSFFDFKEKSKPPQLSVIGVKLLPLGGRYQPQKFDFK